MLAHVESCLMAMTEPLKNILKIQFNSCSTEKKIKSKTILPVVIYVQIYFSVNDPDMIDHSVHPESHLHAKNMRVYDVFIVSIQSH